MLATLAILTFLTLASATDPKYAASCMFSGVQETCQISTWSIETNFTIFGDLLILEEFYFCSLPVVTTKSPNPKRTIPVVPRGQCSFESKVKNAEIMGHPALVIVNNEDGVFPPGGSSNFQPKIPGIMVPSTFFSSCTDFKILKNAKIFYGNQPPPPPTRKLKTFSLLNILV